MRYFFRQLRQRFLSENRIGKYLLYAIGEIALVVFGILIALWIDNQNELRKNESATVENLKEIQNNLVEDLIQCEGIANSYLGIHLVKQKVFDFSAPLTHSDLINSGVREVGRTTDWLAINTNGYENLTNQLGIVPQKFKPILKDLRFLYVQIGKVLDLYQKRHSNAVEEHLNFLGNQNWDLFRLQQGTLSKGEIDYYLEDEHFKNYILKFERDRFNVFKGSQGFRLYAIELYKKIDSLLGIQNSDIPENLIGLGNPKKLAEYLGSYRWGTGNQVEKFYLKDGLLVSDYFDDQEHFSNSTVHYKINDSLYAYRTGTIAQIWQFKKALDGQISIEFLNNENRKIVKIE